MMTNAWQPGLCYTDRTTNQQYRLALLCMNPKPHNVLITAWFASTTNCKMRIHFAHAHYVDLYVHGKLIGTNTAEKYLYPPVFLNYFHAMLINVRMAKPFALHYFRQAIQNVQDVRLQRSGGTHLYCIYV